jgi:hypothetical protein
MGIDQISFNGTGFVVARLLVGAEKRQTVSPAKTAATMRAGVRIGN